MKKVWVHASFKLVDPEHKRPDHRRVIMFSAITPIDELNDSLKKIEELIIDGYVISEMWVTSA